GHTVSTPERTPRGSAARKPRRTNRSRWARMSQPRDSTSSALAHSCRGERLRARSGHELELVARLELPTLLFAVARRVRSVAANGDRVAPGRKRISHRIRRVGRSEPLAPAPAEGLRGASRLERHLDDVFPRVADSHVAKAVAAPPAHDALEKEESRDPRLDADAMRFALHDDG